MNREEYIILKEELKTLANQIKTIKSQFKKAQRVFSSYQREHGTYNQYFEGKIDSAGWEKIRPGYNECYNAQGALQATVEELKHEYRAKHIVYSIARGRTIEQIEPNARKDYWWHEIHKNLVPKYLNEFKVKPILVLEMAS